MGQIKNIKLHIVTDIKKNVMNEEERAIKCVVVGESRVGKTWMIRSFTEQWSEVPDHEIHEQYMLYPNAHVTADGNDVTLAPWDIASHPQYDRLRPLWYANADVFLVCYS